MWHPILHGDLESAARTSIRDIASELAIREAYQLSAFELCEHALLYAYLSLDAPFEDWHDKSLQCMNLAIERLFVAPLPSNGLYGGLAGFGWMVQHAFSILSEKQELARQNCPDEEDPLLEIDERILFLLEDPNNFENKYDLISGYVGAGIYCLERLPKENARLGIIQILETLARLSKETPIGTTWFTPRSLIPPTQIRFAPSGYYNLGVAHGVPGVIAFLAQVATLNLGPEITGRASALLDGAVKWLLAQELPPASISRYSVCAIPGQDCGHSGIAWCYGDLGIAAVLRLVAERTKNACLAGEASSLTYRCIQRQSEYKHVDAPLCHGAVGAAHLYNRAFQTDCMDSYKQQSIECFKEGFALRRTGMGVAGYYSWRPGYSSPDQEDASLLSGAVGVALALLSAVSPIESRWDRIMLLSAI